jgi:hypothetical protein
MSNKKSAQKPIRFAPKLKEYLDETLQLEELKKLNKIDGTAIGSHDQLRIRNNDETKVRTLDNHIFKSMANLIYFFEFLNLHPELINKFGEDIEDLLGLKGAGPKNPKGEGFPRFIDTILANGSTGYDDDTRFNFRRRLLKIMQFLINQKATFIVKTSKDPRGYNDTRFHDMIFHDLHRAEVWTSYLDRLTGNETKKSKRLFDF